MSRGSSSPAAVLALSLTLAACDPTTPTNSTEPAAPLSKEGSAVQAAQVGPYFVPTTITPRPGNAYGVNNKGQVVGVYLLPDFTSRAFIWQNGVFRDLGTLGGSFSIAYAINEAGQVVGDAQTAAGDNHAFLWENGVMRDLGTLGAPFEWGQVLSSATGINNNGQVVGWGRTASGTIRAFIWQNGRMTRLASLERVYSNARAIDNLGRVAGEFGSETNAKAFRWENGLVRSLGTLGGSTSSAWGIFGGRVVGNSLTASGATHGFLWRSGVMTDLGTLGGDFSIASGINSLNQVVGSSSIASGTQNHAFVWENGVMTDLGLGGASGINRNGWIAGQKPDPRATRRLDRLPTLWKPSATPPPTPPPGSILVGNSFFYSEHNTSVNPAVDTVVVGSTVTWEWINASRGGHNVQSIGSPSFASSPIITSRDVTYRITYSRRGTYRYNCVRHPTTMTGRVVVQ
jgi:probable HAF family extracellular repeat protein